MATAQRQQLSEKTLRKYERIVAEEIHLDLHIRDILEVADLKRILRRANRQQNYEPHTYKKYEQMLIQTLVGIPVGERDFREFQSANRIVERMNQLTAQSVLHNRARIRAEMTARLQQETGKGGGKSRRSRSRRRNT